MYTIKTTLCGSEESGKQDGEMDEPSWIMTVKGVKSTQRDEENHREKPQRVAQNGSAPTIISENNHTRAHSQRNERNDHKDKTPSVSLSQ